MISSELSARRSSERIAGYKAAEEKMREAQKKLDEAKRNEAIAEQEKAQLMFNDGIDPRRIRNAIEDELTRLVSR